MNSDANKMDSHNLAVCIGPVLLCPSLGGTTTSTVSDTKKDINAIKLLKPSVRRLLVKREE